MNATALAGRRFFAGRLPLFFNAGALVLAYALPRAFAVIATIVAARVLGAEQFGQFATAAATAVVASILATLGSQQLIVREIAREPSRAASLIASAHALKVGTVTLMALALTATLPFLHFTAALNYAVILLVASYAVGAFVENKAAYFIGVERMYFWTEASALCGLVTGAIGIALVLATHNLLAFCAAPLFGQLAAYGWLTFRAPSTIRAAATASRADVLALARSLAPFAAAFIGTTVYYRADILMLSHMRTASDVGLYGAASKILDVTQALAIACAGALLPRLARMNGERWRAGRQVFMLVCVATIPVALILTLTRVSFIAFVFGAPYAQAVPVFALLAPAMVPLALNMFALSFLVASDRMHAAAIAFAVASGLSIALNIIWIPAHGTLGAASAKLISESALTLMLYGVIRARRTA